MLVFPARAGINRDGTGAPKLGGCVPRESGDKPEVKFMLGILIACSPRER